MDENKKPVGAENAPTKPEPSKTGELYPIVLLKRITGRTPRLQLQEVLCDAVGTKPDEDRLVSCWVEWLARGYNEHSWKWVLDWYAHGIPQRNVMKSGTGPNSVERNLPPIKIEADGGFYL